MKAVASKSQAQTDPTFYCFLRTAVKLQVYLKHHDCKIHVREANLKSLSQFINLYRRQDSPVKMLMEPEDASPS